MAGRGLPAKPYWRMNPGGSVRAGRGGGGYGVGEEGAGWRRAQRFQGWSGEGL